MGESFLTKYELDINVFVRLFSFAISLQKRHAHFLSIRTNGKTHRKKHFTNQKNGSIFHIVIEVMDFRVQSFLMKSEKECSNEFV